MSDDQFARLNARFDTIDQRLGKTDQRFEYLHAFLDDRFAAIDDQFEGLKSDFSRVWTAIDRFSGGLDDLRTEFAALGHKVDRLEGQIVKSASA